MRGRIFDSLFTRMATDPDIFLVIADMGINLVERFQEAYPARFSNVGIAEQNLIGVGAGLCNLGYRPFLYTISNFLVQRCFEQVRNDIAMHEYPAVLLGTSAGYDNAPLGPTHYMLDDLGALAVIPGIDIYCPSGMDYASALIDIVISRNRPAYVRIPKGQPKIPGGTADAFLVEGAQKKVLLISYGTCVQACLEVAKARNDVSVLILNCIRPLDEKLVLQAMRDHERTFTVEDHRPDSGLYSQLCRLCMDHRIFPDLKGLGARAGYPLDIAASPAYLHKLCKIDSEGILYSINDSTSLAGR